MGMKFLNKKGWHTGSLRNIENVWKAEQKDEAEKRKLEELRKQIHEEKERDEFRQLQEQAGFAPRQERLEFLYDSGLSVGKTSNEGFSALQSYPPAAHTSNSSSASATQSSSLNSGPGALFEEKPQSANDSWRKLHSDPLLMIRQREQEALARIKNNPVKMAMIRKSLEAKKKDDEAHDEKQKKVKSKHKRHSLSKHQSGTENESDEDKERKGKAKHKVKEHLVSDEDSGDRERGHTHSRKDHSGEKRRRGSPVNKSRDRKEEHAHLDVDRDSRDRRNGSPVNRRRDRNEGREHVDIDRDSRDRRNGSPVNKRRDRNEGHEHLERDRDSRDRRNDSPVNRRRGRNEGHEHLDRDGDSRERRNGSPVNKRRVRNEGHEHLDRDRDSRDRRNGSPVNKRRERNGGHEHLDRDGDSRDRKNGSPVNKRQDRNEGSEQLGIDMDSREIRKDYRHSRRDYGSEDHGIPEKEKASKIEGRQRLDVDKDLRDTHRTKDDYGSKQGDEKLSRAKSPADSRDKPSSSYQTSDIKHAALPPKPESHRRRGKAPQLSEEERAARLREMQMDAELHEENRWKRLKKAEEEDAQETSKATVSRGSSFLDDVQKSVYGAEKGGSSTIEESVRRRSHFSQGRTQVDEHNAFRR